MGIPPWIDIGISLNSYLIGCGDWCPQFGEPELYKGHTALEICQRKRLLFDKFTDERINNCKNGENKL